MLMRWSSGFLVVCLLLLMVPVHSFAFTGEVPLGAGSYSTVKPPGVNDVQPTIYKTSNVGKMPTNDWWSSTAWVAHSERQYPHPLAVQNQSNGLRVYNPAQSITGNSACVCGFMPEGTSDFTIGHSAVTSFPDTKVDGFNDWFVTNLFSSGANSLKVTYGHGSPYIFAEYTGGNPRLTFSATPTVWSGNSSSPVLGITVNNVHYALFGPTGSTWSGIGTSTLTNSLNGKNYFSIAALPDHTVQTLNKFKQYAYAFVTDSKVNWSYQPTSSQVVTTYSFTTTAKEGTQSGTLFAMYPHQWRNSAQSLLPYTYRSVYGLMKTAEGSSFQTTMKFNGVLPTLPDLGSYDKNKLRAYIDQAEAETYSGGSDTYWYGKRLGQLATLAPIADQVGDAAAASKFRNEIKAGLQDWLKASNSSGALDTQRVFYYNSNWGTLLGYPDSFGSVEEMNDHHFHYGYFIKAAAEIARVDRTWASDSNWGQMVQLLIRDIASPNRNDSMFPFLRNFDIYAGHSWASGHARFGDGNNNESSSEAMNAWAGIILWGEATGNTQLRDLGIYLYTTEMNAIQEYWFDVHDTNHHPDFTRSTASMVWGGKIVGDGVWWTGNPEEVHGINWLPITAASLYLTQHPAYTQKNYNALVAENGGTNWDVWSDIIWMYRAIHNPTDAINQMNQKIDTVAPESGNSRANTYHWIHNLNAVGTTDLTITADYPIYAVFTKNGARTYVVYNMRNTPVTVTFSNGVKVVAAANSFGISSGDGGVVTPPPSAGHTPYLGGPISLPGVVEAEFYDLGGQGAAYHDVEAANQGGQLRTADGVDLEVSTDVGGGHNVGWTEAGEWLKYSVSVTASGTYNLEARVASQESAGRFRVELNGTDITGTISVPNTGGWQTWQTISKPGITLPAGNHVIRIFVENGGFNLNWLKFNTVTGGGGGGNQTADFTANMVKTGTNTAKVTFTPTTAARYVDVHYTVNGGPQLNLRMTNVNGTWEHSISGLSAGNQVRYWFTYEKSGPQYTSQAYNYTH